MRWLDALMRREPVLDPGHRAALQEYRSRKAPNLHMPLTAQRLVVVDVETSGLNPFSDRLISIGAVTVSHRLVRFDDSFEIVLKQVGASDHRNILIHGIGESAQRAGREPREGLLEFLLFAERFPLVAFNADFDRIVIERATRGALGIKPANAWLDLAILLPALFPRHAAAALTLDQWMRAFGIDNYARHDAVADALATAQLLLVTLARARRENVTSCAQLLRLQRAQRWLGRQGRV